MIASLIAPAAQAEHLALMRTFSKHHQTIEDCVF